MTTVPAQPADPQPTNTGELTAEAVIEARIAELDALIKPYEDERRQLYSELGKLKHAALLQKHGFSVGDPLAVTDELIRHLRGRKWEEYLLIEWEEQGTVYLEHLQERGNEVFATVGVPNKWGTGNVPLGILQRMKAAVTLAR